MIFFHDKHWYRSEPLFAVEEEDEEEEEEEEEEEVPEAEAEKDESEGDSKSTDEKQQPADAKGHRPSSRASSQGTVTSAPASSLTKKTEYEFLLFNYLLRFVHREGQIGDFARAGLLFLMDVAMSPSEPVHRLTGEDSSSTTEVASSDPVGDAALSLAEYIVDGDFSEVLGAGLGAVYSQLPSKLEIRPSVSADGAEGNSMVLGNNPVETADRAAVDAAREKTRGLGMEESTSPDFKSRLDHFLKLAEFLEDVLRRNIVHDTPDATAETPSPVGSAIVTSILDAVRRIFLENVLYPSILECSDIDGSAVAVMSYIDIMIRTLNAGRLSHLLVDFLMSEDNDEVTKLRQRPFSMLTLGEDAPPQVAQTDKQTKLRRRRSSAMVFLEMEAPESTKQSEYFTSMGRFTLKDLLLSNLRSPNKATGTSALQLLQSLLHQHNQLCVERLFVVVSDPNATSFPEPTPITLPGLIADEEDDATLESDGEPTPPIPLYAQPATTFSTHEREMNLYLNLVSRVDPSHVSDTFSTGYDKYLGDALAAIQEQCLQIDLDDGSNTKFKHRLNPNDPILTLILDSLRRLLSNTPEFNIALTGVLATLAYDPNRSLAGWLTFAYKDEPHRPKPERRISGKDGADDGDDRSIDFRIEESLSSDSRTLPASSLDDSSRPVILTIFQGLVAQLERYRQAVDNFDRFLLERRQGLLFSENLTDALTLALDLDDPNGMPQFRSPPSTAVPPETPPRAKPAPQKKSSSFVSFLTPKKKLSASAKNPAAMIGGDRSSPSKNVAASPFGPHYQRTSSISVEPFEAPSPLAGPWTPSTSRKFNADEEDVFTSGWGESEREVEMKDESEPEKPATVTLSRVLDNVVILEESIKELVAVIHARRSLGIDAVRYL